LEWIWMTFSDQGSVDSDVEDHTEEKEEK